MRRVSTQISHVVLGLINTGILNIKCGANIVSFNQFNTYGNHVRKVFIVNSVLECDFGVVCLCHGFLTYIKKFKPLVPKCFKSIRNRV